MSKLQPFIPALLVVISALAPFLFSIFISHSIRVEDPIGVTLAAADQSLPQVVAARLSWGGALLIYSLTTIVALLIFSTCFVRLGRAVAPISADSSGAMSTLHVVLFVVLFVLLLVLVALAWRWLPNPLSVGSTDYPIRFALEKMKLWRWPHDGGAVPGVACASLFLVISASSLWKIHVLGTAQDESQADQQARVIERRLTALRRALFAGAIVLAAAMLWSSALHGLITPFVPKEEIDSVKQLTSSVVAAQGVLWSSVLIAIYAPAASWLTWTAQQLARGHAKPPPPSAAQQPAQARASDAELKTLRAWLGERGPHRSVLLQTITMLASLWLTGKVQQLAKRHARPAPPLAAQQTARARANDPDLRTQRAWLDERGLSRSVLQQTITVLTSFAPLFIGFVGKVPELV